MPSALRPRVSLGLGVTLGVACGGRSVGACSPASATPWRGWKTTSCIAGGTSRRVEIARRRPLPRPRADRSRCACSSPGPPASSAAPSRGDWRATGTTCARSRVRPPMPVHSRRRESTSCAATCAIADAVALAMRGCSHVIHLAAAKSGVVRADGRRQRARYRDRAGRGARGRGAAYGFRQHARRARLRDGAAARRAARRCVPTHPTASPSGAPSRSRGLAHERVHASRSSSHASPPSIGRGARGWLPMAQRHRRWSHAPHRRRLEFDRPRADSTTSWTACSAARSSPRSRGDTTCSAPTGPRRSAGFATRIAGALGVPAPAPGLPAAPFRMAQHAAALVFRLTRKASPFVHDREVLVADKRAVSARATRGARVLIPTRRSTTPSAPWWTATWRPARSSAGGRVRTTPRSAPHAALPSRRRRRPWLRRGARAAADGTDHGGRAHAHAGTSGLRPLLRRRDVHHVAGVHDHHAARARGGEVRQRSG